MNEAR